MERCFGGPVYVMTTPIPAGKWPYQLAYEWGRADQGAGAAALLLSSAVLARASLYQGGGAGVLVRYEP